MQQQMDKIIDISVTLSKDTVIYPGDPAPEYMLFCSLADGGIANVGGMKHGLHHGTHVDVPYHFKDGSRTFEQMTMEHWVGPALVVDATLEDECISARTLEGINLDKHRRILFKTKNSTDYYKRPAFYERFIYLDRSACELMVKHGILTAGLDYITVDPYGSEGFPAHTALLWNGVCIIECINLDGVEPGEYYLMCLPLKLHGTDGANARAVLLRPGFSV